MIECRTINTKKVYFGKIYGEYKIERKMEDGYYKYYGVKDKNNSSEVSRPALLYKLNEFEYEELITGRHYFVKDMEWPGDPYVNPKCFASFKDIFRKNVKVSEYSLLSVMEEFVYGSFKRNKKDEKIIVHKK